MGLVDRSFARRLRLNISGPPVAARPLRAAGRHRPDGDRRDGAGHRAGGDRRRGHRGPEEQAGRLRRDDHLVHPHRAAGLLVRGAAQDVRGDQGQRGGRAHDPLHARRGVTRHLARTAPASEIFKDRLQHLVLPTIALAGITYAAWSRFQRASMLDVLGSEYMRLARAKGLPWRKVLVKHGLRNALIPTHDRRRPRSRCHLRRRDHHRDRLQLERHGSLPDPERPGPAGPQRRAGLADRRGVLHRAVQPHRRPVVRGPRPAYPA